MPELDLDTYLALPRVSGLALSPDGRRLLVSVTTLDAKGNAFRTALWELDPEGERAPRRLTRSSKGEGPAHFTSTGDALFTTARRDPDLADDPLEEVPGLWRLPAGGGEAEPLVSAPGGIDAVAPARAADVVAVGVLAHPGAADADEDLARAKARKDAEVTAQLFDRYPIRYWDHYLGPRERRIATVDLGTGELREIHAGGRRAFDDADLSITPDGSTIVAGMRRSEGLDPALDLVAVDVASGEVRVLASGDADHGDVAVSPDGRAVVCVRAERGDATTAGRQRLFLVELTNDERRELAPDLDLWPTQPRWSPTGDAIYFCADELGHRPVFRLSLHDGTVTRLTASGAYTDVCPSPDGSRLFALRSSIASPPQVVVLDPHAAEQHPATLPTPGHPVELPGRVSQIATEAADGTPIFSWLVLPPDASPERPAPLVLWIHGGPVSSWNDWSWRWNPHLLAQRGYAVLLPDPALSTGYGLAFTNRGRGRWGHEPYTDLMAAVDATVARPDIDENRTAAMGGSFGGYMANWVAGHTDRFRCIVTHASLWALDQFHGTTDLGVWWEREFGDPYADPTRYVEHSPNRFVGDIRTPMLVIHGELDHRVPIGEALRLWTDLQRHGVESKFLYFPDENHWILKPRNSRVWYETVFAWLDRYVLDEEWRQPELL